MSRLEKVFAKLRINQRKGLIAYLTVGCPDRRTTVATAIQLAAAGADIIEFGIPFSDPMADGPIIQKAATIALRGGMTTSGALEILTEIGREVNIPLVAMTYINTVIQFGERQFADALAAAGVDGLVVPDLPVEEAEQLAEYCRDAGINLIQFVAPTTSAMRAGIIAKQANGFIYCVSSTGVTGVRQVDYSRVEPVIAAIRQTSHVPVAIGFGIGDGQAACSATRQADAVIVGSAVMQRLMDEGLDSAVMLIKDLRIALDRGEVS